MTTTTRPPAATVQGPPPNALAERAQQWVAMGIDPDRLHPALRTVGAAPGSDRWTAHFTALGEEVAERAARSASVSDDTARAALEEASFWFFLARFPTPSTPAGWTAYRRSLDTALLAGSLETVPLRIVRAPHGDGEVIGHLRLASTDSAMPTPLVVLTGGIDVFKADIEIRSLATALHNAGISTLAVDMPGTGQSPVIAEPGAEATYGTLLDGLALDPDLSPLLRLDAVGVVGLSFGGHWAVKLALTNPRIAACVNISGPLHHTFTTANVNVAPPPTRAALAAAVRARSVDIEEIQPALAALSILDGAAGNLFTNARATPILTITGRRDELVPLADATLLTDHGHPADTLIYATDRHVASNHWNEHVPILTNWLQHRLHQPDQTR
jgi:esterase FrsA